MDKTLHLLVVGPDAALQREFDAALRSVENVRAVVHAVADLRQGIEVARARQPDLVFVEMSADPRVLREFAEEAALGAPDSVVVGVYRREILGNDVSEGGLIIDALRSRVRDFLRRPLSSAELESVIERHVRRATASNASPGKVVAFVSNKGGVGKSTLALNAACSLAVRHPDRVLLVDASLQLGVCASMLDLAAETTLADAVRELQRLDATLLRQMTVQHECGLRLLAAPVDAADAAIVGDAAISRVITLARRDFDFVVVDTFPLLDAVALAILDLSDQVNVVVGPSVPNVLGGTAFLALLDQLGVERSRQRVLLNHHFPRVSGALETRDIAARLGREVAHVFPYSKRLLVAMNTGRPLALSASRHFGFGRRMSRFVREIEESRSSEIFAVDDSEPARDAIALPAASNGT